MICPSCGKGRLVLKRIEYMSGTVTYIYVCESCGFELEVKYRFREPDWWWYKHVMRARW